VRHVNCHRREPSRFCTGHLLSIHRRLGITGLALTAFSGDECTWRRADFNIDLADRLRVRLQEERSCWQHFVNLSCFNGFLAIPRTHLVLSLQGRKGNSHWVCPPFVCFRIRMYEDAGIVCVHAIDTFTFVNHKSSSSRRMKGMHHAPVDFVKAKPSGTVFSLKASRSSAGKAIFPQPMLHFINSVQNACLH
jgi:hypothetical protein